MSQANQETTNINSEKTSINNEKTTSKEGIEQCNNKTLLSLKAGVNVWLLNPQILERMSLPTGALDAATLA
jgi:hypothetical protein